MDFIYDYFNDDLGQMLLFICDGDDFSQAFYLEDVDFYEVID